MKCHDGDKHKTPYSPPKSTNANANIEIHDVLAVGDVNSGKKTGENAENTTGKPLTDERRNTHTQTEKKSNMAAGAGGNDVFPFFPERWGGSSSESAGTAAAIAAVGRVLCNPLEVTA